MPQIQDYSAPETQGQGPVGGISPNMDAVSAPGRALQNIGNTLEQASDMFHRRDAAKETSDVYATFAKMRADWTNQLEEQSSDPNFDTQKFQQSYGDQVDELSQKYNTAEGKDFFNKQAARLGGALLTRASKIQMQQAGDQAKAELQEGVNTDAATLIKDPTQFADVVDAGQEFVHAQVASNPKLSGHEEMLKQYMAEQQAVAALKGYQNQNPGSFADGEDGLGKKMLDSGEFDKYLKPGSRDKLENYFKASSRANDAQSAIQDRAQQKAIKEGTENFETAMLPKMLNGTFSPKDVLNAKLPDGTDIAPAVKMHLIDKAREYAIHQFDSNPNVKADILSKIARGEITDSSQIVAKVGRNSLSPQDASELSNLTAKTPEAKEEMKADKAFMQQMGTAIRFKTMNNAGQNVYSPVGDTKYAQAVTDYNNKKADLRKAGKPVSDIRDPSSPSYFNLEQYKTSPADQYKPAIATPPAPKQDTVTVIKDGVEGTMPRANYEKNKAKYKLKE